MNVVCVICCDLVSLNDMHFTKCGHIYHFTCIKTWLTKSLSCPQCRVKTSLSSVYKIYPTLANNSGDKLSVAELQNELDDNKLKLLEKDVKIKELFDNYNGANEKIEELKKSAQVLTNKLAHKEATITLSTKKIQSLEIKGKKVDMLERDNESLVHRLEMMSGLKKILDDTNVEVETMVQNHNDVRTVCTYLTAMKKAFEECKELNRSLRTKLEHTSHELKVTREKYEALRVEMENLKRKEEQSSPSTPTPSASRSADMRADKEKSDHKLKWLEENRPSNSPYLALKQSSIPFSALRPKLNSNTVEAFRTAAELSSFEKKLKELKETKPFQISLAAAYEKLVKSNVTNSVLDTRKTRRNRNF